MYNRFLPAFQATGASKLTFGVLYKKFVVVDRIGDIPEKYTEIDRQATQLDLDKSRLETSIFYKDENDWVRMRSCYGSNQ